jgi:uncharacterized protein YbjT (DUF2867 family)
MERLDVAGFDGRMTTFTDNGTSTESARTILITGGTGKTGRRVVQRLQGLEYEVRAGSRHAAAGDVRFDWLDEATWASALDGASAAYLAYAPDLCVHGAVEAVGRFAGLAARMGVGRVVLLSGRGEPEALRAERAVRAAAEAGGAEWTVVRCAWFDQNFSESFMLDGVLAGELVLPVTGVMEPFLDADDIADVAVAALTRPGHHAQEYELTGPRCLGFAEAVSIVGAAVGREIRFVPVPIEDYVAALRDFGLPEDVVSLYRYLLTEVLDGRNQWVADGVQRALGRPARTFEAYAHAAAASGVWSVTDGPDRSRRSATTVAGL